MYPNYAMTWMTTVTMDIRTKTFDVQTHHTRVKLSESFVMSTYRTQFWIRDRVWWHFARQFFGWSDSKFSASAEISTSSAPSPYQSHISHLSTFLSKLKPSLLACSAAASSPATPLHAPRPRLSRQVIHTRPPSSSSFHIPHAQTTGASATPSTQITDPSTK